MRPQVHSMDIKVEPGIWGHGVNDIFTTLSSHQLQFGILFSGVLLIPVSIFKHHFWFLCSMDTDLLIT